MFDLVIYWIFIKILKSFQLFKPENKETISIKLCFLVLVFQDVDDKFSELLQILKLTLLTERVKVGFKI